MMTVTPTGWLLVSPCVLHMRFSDTFGMLAHLIPRFATHEVHHLIVDFGLAQGHQLYAMVGQEWHLSLSGSVHQLPRHLSPLRCLYQAGGVHDCQPIHTNNHWYLHQSRRALWSNARRNSLYYYREYVYSPAHHKRTSSTYQL